MARPKTKAFGQATKRIGWVFALVAAVGMVTGVAQGQRGRGPQGPPDIGGKWSGTWSSFNPAQATAQPREVCKKLDADVVKNGDMWVATFEGDCGRPYKYKISMNGRLASSVVLFTGTVDNGAVGTANAFGKIDHDQRQVGVRHRLMAAYDPERLHFALPFANSRGVDQPYRNASNGRDL